VVLDPARAPGSVEVLLGNANGDIADEFALGTGDPGFAAAAAGTAGTPGEATAPGGAPELGTTVGILAACAEAVEGDKTLVYTLYRLGDTAKAVEVAYALGGGVGPADLAPGTPLGGTLRLAPGQTATTLGVTLADDARVEGPELLEVAISPGGDVLTGAATARTQIVDDDLFGAVRPSDGVIRGTGRDDALASGAGGNVTTLAAGPALDLAQFAETVLGTPVPEDGVTTGSGVTIPDPMAAMSADMADLTDFF
jgi:hypothetical protein